MQKITCHFDKAQYLPGEPVRLILPAHSALLSATFFRMERPVTLQAVREDDTLVLTDVPVGGYGVRISTEDGVWEGAFDVVSDRRTEIRYGFLSDFSSGDGDRLDVEWMRDLHLNAVQFYDWMYRHDRLLPPTEQYDDPMGRPTDLGVISKKIEHCKACGIRPLAYGAVYAATKDTFAAHPTWGMYTMGGQPMTFAGWLYYMNVASSCGWAKHIVEEFRSAVRFGFSGIHMDTYGFPKRIWDAEHRPVELADEFPRLINAAAQAVGAFTQPLVQLFQHRVFGRIAPHQHGRTDLVQRCHDDRRPHQRVQQPARDDLAQPQQQAIEPQHAGSAQHAPQQRILQADIAVQVEALTGVVPPFAAVQPFQQLSRQPLHDRGGQRTGKEEEHRVAAQVREAHGQQYRRGAVHKAEGPGCCAAVGKMLAPHRSYYRLPYPARK